MSNIVSLTGRTSGLPVLSYLQVLDAQRTFFEIKRQYITALADYHKAKATIERLIGDYVK
jgi:outer membrane protein TolC